MEETNGRMNEKKTRVYFAYGSNMDRGQMSERCPGAISFGVARLDDHNFIINTRGVASVIPRPSKEVYGVLWRIGRLNERVLDEYEGVKNGIYGKKIMKVIDTINNKPVSALIYVASEITPGRSRDNYIERIVASAEREGLPASYIEELKLWL